MFVLSLNNMHLNEKPGSLNSLEAISELPSSSAAGIGLIILIDYESKKGHNKALSSKNYLHYYSPFV